MFHYVAADLEIASLILDRDQGALRAIVHGDLERLDQGPHALDVPLDAEVAENQQRRGDGRFLECGEGRDEER